MKYYAHVDGSKIEYIDRGHGPVIVLIHGTQSSSLEPYHVDQLILSGFRVIVPSRPGYGETPYSFSASPQLFASRLAHLMQMLEIDQYHVYGISAGGPTAIELASQNQRVRSLTLAAAVTSVVDFPYRDTVSRNIVQPAFIALQYIMKQFIARAIQKHPFEATARMIQSTSVLALETIREEVSPYDIFLLKRVANQMAFGLGAQFDLKQRVSSEVLLGVTCPTYIIHSKNDKAVPVRHAHYAKRLIPHAQLTILNSPGHLIWVGRQARKSERQIERFIRFNS
ncbi:alpha/beta fold hydrolase [Exiguobacterium aestuarii]|uniref:Alpha/beta fold hydrolase n=1 Tax=Exiguobacterium aestuarii TaxID=273527 RepID=A0ABW2PLC3_9BACL|nr:alpha/beta hydrolase [Exiguobacterium aestuarii]MCT4784779.1 alpha/beta hydrolase [Exiguobacterium aestuarii]